MLGDILRQEREKQNMTVKDVEAETSIRALYISSIEEGKYDALPGEVYLKGFIRTYATCLKLDPVAMLKLYYEEKTPPEFFAEKSVGAADLSADRSTSPSSQSGDVSIREKVRSAKREKENKFTKVFAVSAAVFVVAGLCYWGIGMDSQPQLSPVPAPVAVKQAPPVPEQKSVQAVTLPKQMNGVEVTAKYADKCWTEVVADDKRIYEGIPEVGEVMTWKANQVIVFRSGNAGAVEVTHNGKAVGKLGGNGEVVVKQFTTDKIADAK